MPAASFGARSDGLHHGCHVLVGPVARGGPVPGRPIEVAGLMESFRECSVCVAALRARGGLVDRGPDQGVPDAYRVPVDHEESGRFDRRQRLAGDSQRFPRPGQDREVSGVVGRGQQHHRLPGHRQGATTVEEGSLHPVGQGQLVRQGRSSGELGVAELSGQFHQRERVASGAGSEGLDDGVGDVLSGAFVEQCAHCVVGQPFEAHHLDVGRSEDVGVVVTGGEEQEHGFGEQPARGEQQRVR